MTGFFSRKTKASGGFARIALRGVFLSGVLLLLVSGLAVAQQLPAIPAQAETQTPPASPDFPLSPNDTSQNNAAAAVPASDQPVPSQQALPSAQPPAAPQRPPAAAITTLGATLAAQQSQTPQTAQSAANPALMGQDPNNVAELSAILQQSGIAQQTAPAPPPGMDLPVDQSLNAVNDLSTPQKQAELRREAFDAAVTGLMPMKPGEIRRVLEIYDETQQAVETPIYPHPKPEMTFSTVSLSPNQEPLTLHLAVGHVSTLSLVDSTGQPWPIQDISWAGNFEIQQPETGGNILRITPMAEFAFGNVSMRLVDLNTPIILYLKTGRDRVQVRVDLQVPELGPKGVAPVIEQPILTAAGSGSLSSILGGVVPAEAEKLSVSGADGRTTAYRYGGTTYVRTPYTLLSPAWNSSVRSADGTSVYAMNFAPVLLLSDKGQMIRVNLKQDVQEP